MVAETKSVRDTIPSIMFMEEIQESRGIAPLLKTHFWLYSTLIDIVCQISLNTEHQNRPQLSCYMVYLQDIQC